MQKSAFLFPGQGSQAVGMMSGFVDSGPTGHGNIVRATFAEASAVLGYDLWDLAQNGPEERLGMTEITQPALLTASTATWRVWNAGGRIPISWPATASASTRRWWPPAPLVSPRP
jgi:[acyl-carrier-protein] S-malonyltransferase